MKIMEIIIAEGVVSNEAKKGNALSRKLSGDMCDVFHMLLFELPECVE